MYEVHSLKIRSVAKIASLVGVSVYIAFGVVVTSGYWLVGLVVSASPLGIKVSVLSFFLVWLAGAVGVYITMFLAGLVAGFVYNRAARWWGGIQIELTKPESKMEKRSENEHKP